MCLKLSRRFFDGTGDLISAFQEEQASAWLKEKEQAGVATSFPLS
jgi:hypothetical protein